MQANVYVTVLLIYVLERLSAFTLQINPQTSSVQLELMQSHIPGEVSF